MLRHGCEGPEDEAESAQVRGVKRERETGVGNERKRPRISSLSSGDEQTWSTLMRMASLQSALSLLYVTSSLRVSSMGTETCTCVYSLRLVAEPGKGLVQTAFGWRMDFSKEGAGLKLLGATEGGVPYVVEMGALIWANLGNSANSGEITTPESNVVCHCCDLMSRWCNTVNCLPLS